MNFPDIIFLFLSAVFGGIVNAVAGGGTLITFPVLIAVGVPPVSANVTNTVALCPGYISGALAQKRDLTDQVNKLYFLIPVALTGGIAGGIILLNTGERIFNELVPFLILLASLLLAFQNKIKKYVFSGKKNIKEKAGIFPLFLASIYGGYFGAGVSVIILAILGLVFSDSITKLNALKQLLSFFINIAAAVYFLFSGYIFWEVVIIMIAGSLIGGATGGKFARKINPGFLRKIVVVIGIAISIIYFLK